MKKEKYYNTTGESGKMLEEFKAKTMNQDAHIYSIFKKDPDSMLSASIIGKHMRCPLTSIRRSLNTLMNSGKIEKLIEKRVGAYGRPEHLYKFVK